jgi:hypothetical protein
MDWWVPWVALFGPMLVATLVLAAGTLGWLPNGRSRDIPDHREEASRAQSRRLEVLGVRRKRTMASVAVETDGLPSWAEDLEEASMSLRRKYPYFSMS